MVLDLLFGKPLEEIVIKTIKDWKPRKPKNDLSIKRAENYYRDLLKKNLEKNIDKDKALVYHEKSYTGAGNADISIEKKQHIPEIIIELKKYSNFQSSEYRRLTNQINEYCKVKGIEYLFIVFVGDKPNKKLYMNEIKEFVKQKNKEVSTSLINDFFDDNRIQIFEK